LERTASPRAKAALPLELAEAWFELQELAFEAPAGEVSEKISAFEKLLHARMEQLEHLAREQEALFDQAETGEARRAALAILALRTQDLQYLRSLSRDVQRLRMAAVGVA
jgi:hypothetical protein